MLLRVLIQPLLLGQVAELVMAQLETCIFEVVGFNVLVVLVKDGQPVVELGIRLIVLVVSGNEFHE